MSSPEAHSGTPNQQNPYREHNLSPDAESFVADQGNYAYGAEAEDGNTIPEPAPLDPETQAYYAQQGNPETPAPLDNPEVQAARDTIHSPIRTQANKAVESAISDAWRDHHLQETGIKPLESKIEKQTKKVEAAHANWKTEDDKNAAKGRLSSRKQRALKRTEYKEAAKQRKLEKAKKRINNGMTETVAKQNSDTLRQSDTYVALMEDVRKIDEEIRTRNEIRALVDDPTTSEERKAFFEQAIASWGEQTDEQYRAEQLAIARDAYEEHLKQKEYDESVEPFKKAVGTDEKPGPILERLKLVKQLERATDPAEIARLNISLAKSYEQFISELFDGDVEGFKNWALDSALKESRGALRSAAKEVIGMRKDLQEKEKAAKKLIMDKKRWENADAATQTKKPWTEADDLKLAKAIDDVAKAKDAITEKRDAELKRIKKDYNKKVNLTQGL